MVEDRGAAVRAITDELKVDQAEREAIQAEGNEGANRRTGATPASIVRAWRAEGPLIHEPTGIETLDAATGGGPVYGSRWFLSGAPDAGKTQLLVQIADVYARAGVAVGLLAVDEEPDDVVTRLAQRAGLYRRQCERRTSGDLVQLEQALEGLAIRLYDAEWTIEAAAEDLARWAQERGTGAMLGIDSVQTVRCDLEATQGARELGAADAVTARVSAIRSVATRHRLIAIATSEMNRAAYKGKEAEQVDLMASSKWSGAIEYSARVLLALRSVKGEKDLVRLELVKNKQRPADNDTRTVHLRLDRGRQELTETAYAPPAPEDDEERTRARDMAAMVRVVTDAAALAVVLADRPGLTTRELRAAARADAGMGSTDRFDAALVRLEDAVVRVPGARRAQYHHLLGSSVPKEVLDAVPLEDRPRVAAARPQKGAE